MAHLLGESLHFWPNSPDTGGVAAWGVSKLAHLQKAHPAQPTEDLVPFADREGRQLLPPLSGCPRKPANQFWQMLRRCGQIKALAQGAEKAGEKAKAGVRAFVEHSFHILKNIFGRRKVRH